LWALILSLWTVAVTIFSRRLPDIMLARVIGIMGLISTGFLLFILTTSNPFKPLTDAATGMLFAAPEGRDLNPLLQDPGLIMHPPILYMGYVGFSVVFSFAIAALLGGKLDSAWARWSRPWTTAAWIFLTLGITLGSWWAYYELGWGGWWFWDPVENASFMPWLVGTALIHSLAVTEKRGVFQSWTVMLAILAFSMSLLGTFLVRSGVLVSVHAFASDPARGIFILVFLALVVGGSLLLYALRAGQIRGNSQFELLSRETLLLLNNMLLVVAAAAVLIGTLYPLVYTALGLGTMSVGKEYFNLVFSLIMLPLVFLTAVGPLVRWKSQHMPTLVKHLLPIFLLGIAAGLGAWLAAGLGAGISMVIALATWVAVASLEVIRHRRARKTRIPLNVAGMVVAHIGLAVFIIGVTLTTYFSQEETIRMKPGEHFDIKGYRFRFDGTRRVTGPNYIAQQGTVHVSRDGKHISTLHPQKRIYLAQRNPMTEAAIDPGFTRDLFVALGDNLGGGTWTLRLQVKPFIRWIWSGAVFMALGGLLAASDRRYRIRSKPAGATS
jgi:cytochrome c-type biogenesis protein CcmF